MKGKPVNVQRKSWLDKGASAKALRQESVSGAAVNSMARAE